MCGEKPSIDPQVNLSPSLDPQSLFMGVMERSPPEVRRVTGSAHVRVLQVEKQWRGCPSQANTLGVVFGWLPICIVLLMPAQENIIKDILKSSSRILLQASCMRSSLQASSEMYLLHWTAHQSRIHVSNCSDFRVDGTL